RQRNMEASSADTVRIVSRRMVRPSHGAMPVQPSEDIHLTPWDLCCIGMEYIQRGVLLSKPTAGGEMSCLVDTLASSLARALGRYYHLAGRLAVEEHGDRTIIVPLRCTGEGAELVHAAAPGVAVADIVGSVYTPSPVVWGFFPLNGLRGADAAIVSLPVLWAQVTELADDIFIGMSMNHSVGDGTSFWELFNAWSAINRGDKRMVRWSPRRRGCTEGGSSTRAPCRYPFRSASCRTSSSGSSSRRCEKASSPSPRRASRSSRRGRTTRWPPAPPSPRSRPCSRTSGGQYPAPGASRRCRRRYAP
uniref:Acetyltransferase n=1 Tax=Aegilops tauschii subsp. strangulata TaxID=200361 RepID=A0A453G5N9_AEGTS